MSNIQRLLAITSDRQRPVAITSDRQQSVAIASDGSRCLAIHYCSNLAIASDILQHLYGFHGFAPHGCYQIYIVVYIIMTTWYTVLEE
jgi:hypothetical protein